jgi:pectinesterase
LPSIYKDLIYVRREKRCFRLIGENAETTVTTHELSANLVGLDGGPIGTFRTPTVVIDADDVTAENIGFEHSAGPVGQARTLRVDGDRATFGRCRFLGWQDTICLDRGRHDFEDGYIADRIDFIFGGATAWFERCCIHGLRNGYVTTASTPVDAPYGFGFSRCRVTGEPHVRSHLGRPWRDHSAVTFLRTEMSEVIRPAGWHNGDLSEREKTSRYRESGTTGPGGTMAARVQWVRALTDAEARALTVEKALGGWNPAR